MTFSLATLILLALFSTLVVWAIFVSRRAADPIASRRTDSGIGPPVLDATLSLSEELVVIIDCNHRVVALSAKLIDLLGGASMAKSGAPLASILEDVAPKADDPDIRVWENKRIIFGRRVATTVSVRCTRIRRRDSSIAGYLLQLKRDGSIGNAWIPTDTMRRRWEGILAKQTADLEKKNQELEASGQKLQELVDRIGIVKDREGMRISQVLRDELDGILSRIRGNVTALGQNLDKGFEKRITAVLAVIDSALGHVDKLIDGIRPPMLDRVGLSAALETIASNFEKTYHISCQTRLIFQEERIGVDLATAVYKIVQESLTNIARHSGATEAKVSLNDGEEGIRLVVADNGRGIETRALLDESALGVIGMRERAKAFGGQLEVAPGTAGGTTVRLFVPAPR